VTGVIDRPEAAGCEELDFIARFLERLNDPPQRM
jgi:hypothetical protein